MHLFGIQLGDDHQQRGNRQQGQGQLPADAEKHGQGGGEHHHAVHHLVGKKRGKMAAPIEIGGQAGHQIAGAVPIEEAHLLMLQDGKEVHPQVEQQMLGRPFQQDDHPIPQPLPQHLHRQHGKQQRQQGGRVLGNDDLIDEPGGQEGVDDQHDAGAGG